jgi:hypothetical protein
LLVDTTFLSTHNARGFVGEFGIPDTDRRWLVVMDRFLHALQLNGIPSTMWEYDFYNGDTPAWWKNHRTMDLNPVDNNGNDEPQMLILKSYNDYGRKIRFLGGYRLGAIRLR